MEWIPIISLFFSLVVVMGTMFAWGWKNLKKDIYNSNEGLKKDINSVSVKIDNISSRLAHLEGYIERDILDKVKNSKQTGS